MASSDVLGCEILRAQLLSLKVSDFRYSEQCTESDSGNIFLQLVCAKGTEEPRPLRKHQHRTKTGQRPDLRSDQTVRGTQRQWGRVLGLP